MSSRANLADLTLETPQRAHAPDLARGMGLGFIALANVMIYLHARPYGLRQHIIDDGAADRAVTALLVTLVDGRAYPLFAALFGYGLVRIADQARRDGRSERAVTRILRRRSLLLIAFGATHAMVGFSGDILGWYGLIAFIVASRSQMSDRLLIRLATGWLLAASALQGLIYANPHVSEQRTFLWSFAIPRPLEAMGWRIVEWLMTPFGLLSVAAGVLLGMWAGRRDVLGRPGAHVDLLRLVAVNGIAIGIAGGIGMALAVVRVWQPPGLMLPLLSWIHILTGTLGGLGYLAAIALLSIHWRRGHVVSALRATGARSLSAYLAQTVVFATLLPAHALGLGASLGSAKASVLALATWLATVAAAVVLDLRGKDGPAEALMKRLRRNA